jgi:hypothetical protein
MSESVQEQLTAIFAADESARPLIRNLRLISEHLSVVGNVTITGKTADGREVIIGPELYNLRPMIQAKIESAAEPRMAKLRALYVPPAPAAPKVADTPDDRDEIIEMVKKQA